MRELREADAFPAADLGLLRAIEALEGKPSTPKALLALGENWRPRRAYAAQHLWATQALPLPASRKTSSKRAEPAEMLA